MLAEGNVVFQSLEAYLFSLLLLVNAGKAPFEAFPVRVIIMQSSIFHNVSQATEIKHKRAITYVVTKGLGNIWKHKAIEL